MVSFGCKSEDHLKVPPGPKPTDLDVTMIEESHNECKICEKDHDQVYTEKNVN